MVVDGNPKPDKQYLLYKLQESQSKLQAEMRANKHLHSTEKDSRSNDSYSCDFPNSKQSSRSRRDSDAARNLGRQTSRNGECIVNVCGKIMENLTGFSCRTVWIKHIALKNSCGLIFNLVSRQIFSAFVV